jgi:hypothetical protein
MSTFPCDLELGSQGNMALLRNPNPKMNFSNAFILFMNQLTALCPDEQKE